MITRRAMQHMSPQRRTAALFDGRHDLELPQTQVGLLSLPPRRTVGAKNIRDLQCGTHHDRVLRRIYKGCRLSSGLTTSRRSLVAT